MNAEDCIGKRERKGEDKKRNLTHISFRGSSLKKRGGEKRRWGKRKSLVRHT